MIVRQPEERFPTAPEGTFPAVCVDEIDLGLVKNIFDPEKPDRHMVRLVWQIDETQEDGKPYHVKQDYTASLHEKAKLRQDLQAWRGRAFTFDELVGFDLENVVGSPCLLSVVHKQGSKGGKFANVGAVMKPPRGMQEFSPRDYVRVKDRKSAPALVSQPRQPQPPPEEMPPEHEFQADDQDVPF